ncbi:MAG: hypothetical protein HYZ53_05755 [Planctomycetes bacterium]|nr:hypothetical protein [Planctomycetota bacterium]
MAQTRETGMGYAKPWARMALAGLEPVSEAAKKAEEAALEALQQAVERGQGLGAAAREACAKAVEAGPFAKEARVAVDLVAGMQALGVKAAGEGMLVASRIAVTGVARPARELVVDAVRRVAAVEA